MHRSKFISSIKKKERDNHQNNKYDGDLPYENKFGEMLGSIFATLAILIFVPSREREREGGRMSAGSFPETAVGNRPYI